MYFAEFVPSIIGILVFIVAGLAIVSQDKMQLTFIAIITNPIFIAFMAVATAIQVGIVTMGLNNALKSLASMKFTKTTNCLTKEECKSYSYSFDNSLVPSWNPIPNFQRSGIRRYRRSYADSYGN